jgi:hypothetical protein
MSVCVCVCLCVTSVCCVLLAGENVGIGKDHTLFALTGKQTTCHDMMMTCLSAACLSASLLPLSMNTPPVHRDIYAPSLRPAMQSITQ